MADKNRGRSTDSGSYQDWNDQRWNDDQGRRYWPREQRNYRPRGEWGNRYDDDDRDRYSRYGYYGDQHNMNVDYDRNSSPYENSNRENDYEGNVGSQWGSSASNNFGSSYRKNFPDFENYSRRGYEGGEDYRNYGGNSGNSHYGGQRFGSGARSGDYNRGSFRDNDYYHQRRENPYVYRDQNRGWWEKAGDEVFAWFGNESAEHRLEDDRRREGLHRGKGPKGYQRSDERIKEDVNDRLSDDAFIDASNIEVTVTNAEVTLTGTVEDRYAKRRAEDIADSVSGVKHVEVRLRIQQDTSRSSYDVRTGTSYVGTTAGVQDKAEKNKVHPT